MVMMSKTPTMIIAMKTTKWWKVRKANTRIRTLFGTKASLRKRRTKASVSQVASNQRSKWPNVYCLLSPFILWRRDTTRQIWRRENPSTVPKWGYICNAYQGLSLTVNIGIFANSELFKETGYLSFEQVRIELRACIEGLGGELVKEISFSLWKPTPTTYYILNWTNAHSVITSLDAFQSFL